MPVDFGQLLGQLKRLIGTLSTRQLVSIGAGFLASMALVVGSASWMSTPTYGLLYADMDAEAAAEIVTRLKSENIPYQLDSGGRSVRVPVERIDELRLQLAAQALPGSSRIGFEIFDRTQFGATEFLEHVNYRRALEGELARTIATIAEVQTARVHIAMAKDSLFARGAEPAKASVVLKLRRNAPLAPATIAGIAGLVSASVESLRPESVVIVDTNGRRLSGVAETDTETGEHLDRQKRLERDLIQKVIALLEPVVGSDRVRVNVSARLNVDSKEETEERFAPETVIRSRQTSTDTGTVPSLQTATGEPPVAGARGNAPAGSSTASPEGTPTVPTQQTTGRTAETTNFEVSKLTRHTTAPPGQVARLSVAVILDDERVTATDKDGKTTTTAKPRSPEALQRIQQLVATSVGLDTERGDQITVENISFTETTPEPEGPTPWWRTAVPSAQGMQVVRGVGILVLAVLTLLFVVRPLMQKALVPPPLPTVVAELQSPRTVADIEGELEANLDQMMASRGDARLPVLTKRLLKTADQEPEQMAKLVRSWLTEAES